MEATESRYLQPLAFSLTIGYEFMEKIVNQEYRVSNEISRDEKLPHELLPKKIYRLRTVFF